MIWLIIEGMRKRANCNHVPYKNNGKGSTGSISIGGQIVLQHVELNINLLGVVGGRISF